MFYVFTLIYLYTFPADPFQVLYLVKLVITVCVYCFVSVRIDWKHYYSLFFVIVLAVSLHACNNIHQSIAYIARLLNFALFFCKNEIPIIFISSVHSFDLFRHDQKKIITFPSAAEAIAHTDQRRSNANPKLLKESRKITFPNKIPLNSQINNRHCFETTFNQARSNIHSLIYF